MAGHLQQHPYYKSFDELQRSTNRMKVFLNMHITDDIERTKVEKMTKLIDEAITYIPKKYQLTKHELRMKEGR